MALPAGLVAGLVSAGSALVTNAWQARRADTAHQREVKDLRKAGLNPVLSAEGGRGAEVGNISDPGEKGVSSALVARRQRAEIGLLEEQAMLTRDQALVARTQAADIQQAWNAGKFRRMVSEAELAELSVQERRQLVPLALERARAEIEQSVSTARASRAVAALNEAARTGALNQEEFERLIGEAGPALRFFMTLIRGIGR